MFLFFLFLPYTKDVNVLLYDMT